MGGGWMDMDGWDKIQCSNGKFLILTLHNTFPYFTGVSIFLNGVLKLPRRPDSKI